MYVVFSVDINGMENYQTLTGAVHQVYIVSAHITLPLPNAVHLLTC
jgi:hypothetical protein